MMGDFRFLVFEARKQAEKYMQEAAEVAKHALCHRSKCGSIIVKDEEIIGTGYNAPPLDKCLEYCLKDNLPKDFKSDKTCCDHAEQRAIYDALKNNPSKLKGSTLYFIRLDEHGEKSFAGDPYCTICSKAALTNEIKEFVLWHKNGICVYNTDYYNDLSFQFKND